MFQYHDVSIFIRKTTDMGLWEKITRKVSRFLNIGYKNVELNKFEQLKLELYADLSQAVNEPHEYRREIVCQRIKKKIPTMLTEYERFLRRPFSKKKYRKIQEKVEIRRANCKLEEQRRQLEWQLERQLETVICGKTQLEAQVYSMSQELVKVRDELRMKEELLRTNEKLLHDVIANSPRNVVGDIESVLVKELECGICSELFIEATTLNCTHTFCQLCIKQWKEKKNDCPICRVQITTETKVVVLDNAIDAIIANLSHDFRCSRISVQVDRRRVD